MLFPVSFLAQSSKEFNLWVLTALYKAFLHNLSVDLPISKI